MEDILLTEKEALEIIKKHGSFVVCIEGGDGCGKQTQAELLVKELNDIAFVPTYGDIAFSRSPVNGEEVNIYISRPDAKYIDFPRYSSESSYFIRSFLQGKYKEIPDWKMICDFYTMDRFDAWINQGIGSMYENNTPMVFDRYCYSNIVYQAARRILENFPDAYETFRYQGRIDGNNIPVGIADIIYETADYVVDREMFGNAKLPTPNIIIYLVFNDDINRENLINKRARQNRNAKLDMNEENTELMCMVNDYGCQILKIAAAHIRTKHYFPSIIEIPCDVYVDTKDEGVSIDTYQIRTIENIHNHIMKAVTHAYGEWDGAIMRDLIEKTYSNKAIAYFDAMTDHDVKSDKIDNPYRLPYADDKAVKLD